MISHIVEDKDAQFLDTIGFVFLQITFAEIIKVVVKLRDDQGGVVQQCLPTVPVAREKLQWLLCPMQDSAVYKTSSPEKKANADQPKAKMPSPKKQTRRAGATATGKAKAKGKAKGRAGRGKGAGRGKPGSRKKKAQAEEEDEEDLDLDEEGQARKKRPAARDSRGDQKPPRKEPARPAADEAPGHVGPRTAQATKPSACAMSPNTCIGRGKYFLDDLVSVVYEGAHGYEATFELGDATTHRIIALGLRFMFQESLPGDMLGVSKGDITKWSKMRKALVDYGKQERKKKLASMDEDSLVKSLKIEPSSSASIKPMTEAFDTMLLAFFEDTAQVGGLRDFLEENDMDGVPVAMLPFVSHIQHAVFKDLMQIRKAGKDLSLGRVLQSIARSLFEVLPHSWLQFAAASTKRAKDEDFPEKGKDMFGTEKYATQFLSLRAAATAHLLSQFTQASMTPRLGTIAGCQRLSFNAGVTKELLAVDVACAAFSLADDKQSEWAKHWEHALSRSGEAVFSTEMDKLVTLMRTEFEKTLQAPQKPEQHEAEVAEGDLGEAAKEEEIEMISLDKSLADMWIPAEPHKDDSEDGKRDLDEMFGEMQCPKVVTGLQAMAVRVFMVEATRAMKKHLLHTVPGMDKGYSRMAIFCFSKLPLRKDGLKQIE